MPNLHSDKTTLKDAPARCVACGAEDPEDRLDAERLGAIRRARAEAVFSTCLRLSHDGMTPLASLYDELLRDGGPWLRADVDDALDHLAHAGRISIVADYGEVVILVPARRAA